MIGVLWAEGMEINGGTGGHYVVRRASGGIRSAAIVAVSVLVAANWTVGGETSRIPPELQRQVEVASGRAKMSWGRSSRRYTGSPQSIAVQFIQERRAGGGAKQVNERFRVTRDLPILTGRLVDLQQELDGLPVFDGHARVTVDTEGRVTHVTDELKEFDSSMSHDQAIGFLEACQAANRLEEGMTFSGAGELGWWSSKNRTEPAYRARATVRKPNGRELPYEVVISGTTGQVLDRALLVTDQCFRTAAADSAANRAMAGSQAESDSMGRGAESIVDSSSANPVKGINLIEATERQKNVEVRGAEGQGTNRTSGVAAIQLDNDEAGWDIPDFSYLALRIGPADVPAGAVVMGITYSFRIGPSAHEDGFYAGDYMVWLASESMVQRPILPLLFGPFGSVTDRGFDDDLEDDSDIEIHGRHTRELNGEAAGAPFYLYVADISSGNSGNLNFLAVEIAWIMPSDGTDNVAGDPFCTKQNRSTVFDPSPTIPVAHGGAFPDGAFTCAAFDELLAPPTDDKYTLTGPYATIVDIEEPFTQETWSTTSSFNYFPYAEDFSAVMCFYHISKATLRLRELGVYGAVTHAVRFDNLGLGLAMNAHYYADSPGMGYVAFGNGRNGQPMAEDADVIYHEYGHALQDNENPRAFNREAGLGGAEPGALGEGFADYWAFSMTFEANRAGGGDPFVIADWAMGPYARRTDGKKRYPDDWGEDNHANGKIWSSVLTQIFSAIGKNAADTIIVHSNYLVPSSGPMFKDAAYAILAADDQVFRGIHREKLCDAFVGSGVLIDCSVTFVGAPTGRERCEPGALCGSGCLMAVAFSTLGLCGLGFVSRFRLRRVQFDRFGGGRNARFSGGLSCPSRKLP